MKDTGAHDRRPAGLYVHIPFCVVRCGYCDFYSLAGAGAQASVYLDAVARDIRSFPGRSGYGPPVASIFLGGGTPSHVEPEGIARILDACREAFELLPGAEITIEGNPESLDGARLSAYLQSGVNRLSVGVQSLRDRTLAMLGRPHTASEAFAALARARKAGFSNISADFIYGLPDQTLSAWREDLRRIGALGLDHISAYLLETDKPTPLASAISAGRLPEPDAGTVAAQWDATAELLGEAGYERYEISNFARQGRACRHNLATWNDEPFIGFGVSAHGYWLGRRTAVPAEIARYIAAAGSGRETMTVIEPPDPLRRLEEAVILGLRLAAGCDFGGLSRRYGVDLFARHADTLSDEVSRGRLEVSGGRVRLTRAGILFANDVLCRFL